MTDSTDPIIEVMSAVSASVFFGSNRKRARNKYSRYMRLVHPDLNTDSRAESASARLNELWEEYETAGSDGSARKTGDSARARKAKTMTRVLRLSTVTLFTDSSAGTMSTVLSWVLVRREPSKQLDGALMLDRAVKLADSMEGSPVSLLIPGATDDASTVGSVENMVISQPDGPHYAVRMRTPVPPSTRLLTLGGLVRAVGGEDRVMGEDLAWIMKRVMYTGLALDSAGVALPASGDSDAHILDRIAIDPAAHHAYVLWYGFEDASDDGILSAVADEVSALFPGGGGRDAGRVKILRFVDGLRYAHHAPAGDVMREYDEMLLDLYGAPRFHEMRIPVTG